MDTNIAPDIFLGHPDIRYDITLSVADPWLATVISRYPKCPAPLGR